MSETNEASEAIVPAAAPVIDGVPQFARAEYAHLPETESCELCRQLLGASYYRAQGKKLCGACAERVMGAFPQDSHDRFVRAMLLGSGAALLGLAVYAGFTIVTHIYLGYLALGVGWFTGKAMMKGSGNVGGRRYQIAGVLLTYAAIAVASVPILLYHLLHNAKIEAGLGELLLRLWPRLLFFGVASPFLALSQPAQGLLGLFILFIGLRIVWRMTAQRAIVVDGPFPVA